MLHISPLWVHTVNRTPGKALGRLSGGAASIIFVRSHMYKERNIILSIILFLKYAQNKSWKCNVPLSLCDFRSYFHIFLYFVDFLQ